MIGHSLTALRRARISNKNIRHALNILFPRRTGAVLSDFSLSFNGVHRFGGWW
jgi:hypothetical protein